MVAIHIERQAKHIIVRLAGELDHHAAAHVREALQPLCEQPCTLILNLAKITFMDSSGLGVILGRIKQLQQTNSTLVVCHIPPAIDRLFHLSGLFKVVERATDEAAALGGVR